MANKEQHNQSGAPVSPKGKTPKQTKAPSTGAQSTKVGYKTCSNPKA